MLRLFHFSHDETIQSFEPRPLSVPVERPQGQDWLNDPLVWAIDEPHSILYLFPRECPRVVVWPKATSTPEDVTQWMGRTSARAVAYIEDGWFERLRRAVIYRYEMPPASFEALNDAGMWVSRTRVNPVGMEEIVGLDMQLAAADVEIRQLESLESLKPVWSSTLHASGIRLRNAKHR